MTNETMTGPVNGEVGRGYDKFMRVATLTVNGAATSYSYDNDGLRIACAISRSPLASCNLATPSKYARLPSVN